MYSVKVRAISLDNDLPNVALDTYMGSHFINFCDSKKGTSPFDW